MSHPSYELLPTKFNGVVFAASWLLSSLAVYIYEKTSNSKLHKLILHIGTILFCLATSFSVLSVDLNLNIWVLYGIYMVYLSIGQYLLTVIYSNINSKLESEKVEVSIFQAVYGFNQFLAFLLCVLVIYLVPTFVEYEYQTAVLFHSNTIVAGFSYLTMLVLNKQR